MNRKRSTLFGLASPARTDSTQIARHRVRSLLLPFCDAGLLREHDALIAADIGRLMDELGPQVLLGAALALAAPRHGHVCADLAALRGAGWPADGDDEAVARLPWPASLEAWIEQIGESPLVSLSRDGEAPDNLPFVLAEARIYTRRYWDYETRIATWLQETATHDAIRDPIALDADALDALFGEPNRTPDRQRVAAALAATSPFSIITGGPGTGKTYTIGALLALLYDASATTQRAAPRVALAAPTGKAAMRMRESIAADARNFAQRLHPTSDAETVELRTFLEGLVPSTLHRLLGFQRRNPTRFRHDAGNPLPYDIVIVDEASMIDAPLMAKLLDAIGPQTKLVLLGDKDQLASVEAGTVFADICHRADPDRLAAPRDIRAHLEGNGAVPEGWLEDAKGEDVASRIVWLSKSRRFEDESAIGRFVERATRQDDDADAAKLVEILLDSSGDEVQLIEPTNDGRPPDAVRDIIEAEYGDVLRNVRCEPLDDDAQAELLEALGRFRILCAHRRGRLGVAGLNALCVEVLEEQAVIKARSEHFVGRPVIVTENDYAVGRFNGDIGVVVRELHDEETRKVVAFPGAEQAVSKLSPSRLPAHETAFALTIHKSQGSEFDHVLIALPDGDSRLLTRELVYTAITRASRRVTLIATRETLVSALGRRIQRASGLRNRLG